jgi:hypothetical protein
MPLKRRANPKNPNDTENPKPKGNPKEGIYTPDRLLTALAELVSCGFLLFFSWV